MKKVVFGLVMAAVSLVSAQRASAQVVPQSFKLGLETNFVSWSSTVLSAPGSDDFEMNVLAFGPAAANQRNGVSGSFVVSPYFMLGAYFGYARQKLSGDAGDAAAGFVEFRPQVEVPFNPDGRFVVSALGALDYEHTNPAGDNKSTAYGPLFGLVGHAFLIPQASLDLGANFRYQIYSFEDEADNVDTSSKELQLSLGMSLWL